MKYMISWYYTLAHIWQYRDTILNHHSGKPIFLQVKCPSGRSPSTKEGDTIIRLKRKSNPYGKQELDEISLRAYTSIHIQEIFKEWENDPSIVENMSDEAIKVIENLKIEFPRLQKWDNIKIITLHNVIILMQEMNASWSIQKYLI